MNYYKVEPVDYQKTLDDVFAVADIITGMVADITTILDTARKNGDNILFEGAQGTMLDIDHGTYPYVTSSNTTAGGVATGSGFGPRNLDYVLGILFKALLYTCWWRSIHHRINSMKLVLKLLVKVMNLVQ